MLISIITFTPNGRNSVDAIYEISGLKKHDDEKGLTSTLASLYNWFCFRRLLKGNQFVSLSNKGSGFQVPGATINSKLQYYLLVK
jgi:hypothetical protein